MSDRLRFLPLLFLAAPFFAVSLRAAETAGGGLEPGTNRAGSDFRDMEMASADPASCQAACKNDESCRAFTYVKPGTQGAKAHCWLKSSVPPATADGNCVSGVVARAAPKAGDPCHPTGASVRGQIHGHTNGFAAKAAPPLSRTIAVR